MEEQHQTYLLAGVIIFVFLIVSLLGAGVAGLVYYENGGDFSTILAAENEQMSEQADLMVLELDCGFFNPNLVLNRFEFVQPDKYQVTNCEDDGLAANYVSFLAYDEQGILYESIGLGFYTKAEESTHTSRVDLLDDIAGNLRLQLPEGSIIENYAPEADIIELEDGEATKQDYALQLTASAGEFAPGDYLLRLVTLTNEENDHGVLAVVMSHIETDAATTQKQLDEAEAFLVLDSLEFVQSQVAN